MLKMSKEKLLRLNENYLVNESVSGVERYSKPKWYAFAPIAASLVLVCGIIGSAAYIRMNGSAPNDLPAASLPMPASWPYSTTRASTSCVRMIGR
jgi:hypothetical protein